MAATKAKRPRKPKGERVDVYKLVTDAIIAKLEEGTIPWRKPWTATGILGVHRNTKTGRAYRGINQMLLDVQGFSEPWWLTMNQANAFGGHVRQGERSTPVVFWKPLRIKPDEGYTGRVDEDGKRMIWMLRYYRVFNIEQIDGVDWDMPVPDEKVEPEPHVMEETLTGYCKREAVRLSRGGDRAYYSPGTDAIRLPDVADFSTPEDGALTFAHEAVHSTGHEKRLDRKDDFASFGSEPYAREELTAEMGAAMLGARFGIGSDGRVLDNQAAYIKSWLGKLRDDKQLVVSAAARAQKAADLIAGPLDETWTDTDNIEGEQS